jgi:rubrerythrin
MWLSKLTNKKSCSTLTRVEMQHRIEFEVKRQECREQGSEERLNSAVEGEKTAIQSEALGTRTPDTVTVTFCTS